LGSAWADLLVKLACCTPRKVQRWHNGTWRSRSQRLTGAAVGRTLLSWARASTAELAQQLVNETPGSRGEALVLECLVDRLNAGKREDALSNLATLRRAHPQRPGCGESMMRS